MINLRVRTEFSFRTAFGHIDNVLKALDSPRVCITDRFGTWGHVEFSKAAKKAGKVPIFGVELAVVADLDIKDPKQRRATYFTFLARSNEGLREIYELVTEATQAENFYFNPRIDYARVSAVSKEVVRIIGSNPEWQLLKQLPNLYVGLSPSSLPDTVANAAELKLPIIALSDNYFPRPEDRATYEVVVGRNRDARTTAMHLLDEYEWLGIYPKYRAALELSDALASECNASLPEARMVKFKSTKSLDQMCREAAPKRGIDLKNPVYRDRLKREIELIKEKDFSDYFYVIADMLVWAKARMLVGPARGSSCGSLVCYLLSITEIDPIPYDLLFERFIDVNRKDLPDIDIDFPDTSRDLVFDYLKSKYGAVNVARLGTVITYKAKNTIDDVARALNIPKWDVEELKSAMIERSGGDSRASFCILDTFNELEIGKATLAKYPELAIAAKIEGHARQPGQHAAGIVITDIPVSNFCTVDHYMDREGGIGVTHLDKKDAEALNLLKIDALGLRTLSVIQDTLDQIGWTREKLLAYPTDDVEAFDILNKRRFAGTFQFDGLALQSLTREMTVEKFEDIAAMTALARPGPLDSGGAQEWIKRRIGKHEIRFIHPSLEPITGVTYGIIVYQEQVMRVVREIGGMTWEETSSIRKAMSGRLGKEFFDNFWLKFKAGTAKSGMAEAEAKAIWENINTMGSWAFNKSHAVAYALVSYWTLVMKAHFPLEYAAACLRNARSREQAVLILRDLGREGFEFKLFDPLKSQANWSVQDGILTGGLLNVKGIGAKKAADIIERRKLHKPLTPSIAKMLENPVLDIDGVFPTRDLWGALIDHPEKFPHLLKEGSHLTPIESISSDTPGEFRILGRVVKKSLRDHNELTKIQKRDGRVMKGQTKYLILTVEDDSGTMLAMVNRHDYPSIGVPIVESGAIGDWYMLKGHINEGMRILAVQQVRKMEVSMLNFVGQSSLK